MKSIRIWKKNYHQDKLNQNFLQKNQEYSQLENIILIAKEYVNFETEKKDLEQILQDKSSDNEIIEMAEKDLNLMKKKEQYENELKIFLLPKDEDDDKNAIVEIRAGTGGLEASLLFGFIQNV